LVGRARGTTSFVHVQDAVEATLTAIEGAPPGLYQVVDDEPAAVADWLPALAAALGAPPPARVPRWLARLIVGAYGVYWMDEVPGASNGKAKRALGWHPSRSSWRDAPVFDLRQP